MAKKNRIYVDTSVFGGVFDDTFEEATTQFFTEVAAGRHVVLLSEIAAGELRDAPERVREFLATLPEGTVEEVELTQEVTELRDAYLAAGVVGPRWADDAAHVAAATVARADVLVSWNFRHLVKWEKIRGFNAVNLRLGYPMMTILSPREVIDDDDSKNES